MSVTKKNNNKPLKVIILIFGVLLIAAGITPYINSYLLIPQTESTEEEFFVSPISETNKNDNVPQETELIPLNEEDARAAKLAVLQEIANSKNDSLTLPQLDNSDDFVIDKLTNSEDKSLFISLDIIRKLVVFIDNFSRGELVSNFSPLRKPIGNFLVDKQDGVITINQESYHRYDKYAQTINNIDTDNFIYLYALLTPLIDEAYQDIGYPSGSFTQTFINAIEHLLETPIIRYKLELISPSVMYKFAEESLESLPDTQKLMLRMGPDNLQLIKFKLREIQNQLEDL
jgi:hypothetical protein